MSDRRCSYIVIHNYLLLLIIILHTIIIISLLFAHCLPTDLDGETWNGSRIYGSDANTSIISRLAYTELWIRLKFNHGNACVL